MHLCNCCSPAKSYREKKSLYKHQRKYDPNFIEPSEHRKISYYSNPKICLECNEIISYELVMRECDRKFCSHSCSAKYNNKKRRKIMDLETKRKSKNETTRLWRKNNKEIDKIRKKEWIENNKNNPKYKAMIANVAAKRRAKKIKATVSWANYETIKLYYEVAQALTWAGDVLGEPCKWHVDHIIPLQGEIVSGLHHQDNLRVIPSIRNLVKSNKFCPEDYLGLNIII